MRTAGQYVAFLSVSVMLAAAAQGYPSCPPCGPCYQCVGSNCVWQCNSCQVCSGSSCVARCTGCMKCVNGGCVPDDSKCTGECKTCWVDGQNLTHGICGDDDSKCGECGWCNDGTCVYTDDMCSYEHGCATDCVNGICEDDDNSCGCGQECHYEECWLPEEPQGYHINEHVSIPDCNGSRVGEVLWSDTDDCGHTIEIACVAPVHYVFLVDESAQGVCVYNHGINNFWYTYTVNRLGDKLYVQTRHRTHDGITYDYGTLGKFDWTTTTYDTINMQTDEVCCEDDSSFSVDCEQCNSWCEDFDTGHECRRAWSY